MLPENAPQWCRDLAKKYSEDHEGFWRELDKEIERRDKLQHHQIQISHPSMIVDRGLEKLSIQPRFLTEEEESFINLDKALVKEELEKIKQEITHSQKLLPHKEYMIPLCVEYADKELVKKAGAYWCYERKSWFFPFNKKRDQISKWLPDIYKLSKSSPYILPCLVPEPVWNVNLRSLLNEEQWKKLKTEIYKKYSYRCRICGNRGEQWPVECNEIWEYKIDGNSSKKAMVYFKGLEALCPNCHQVIHIGKANSQGFLEKALARLIYLNEWTIEEGKLAVVRAFKEWEERSMADDWYFDFTVLEESYGIKIASTPYLREVKQLNIQKNYP